MPKNGERPPADCHPEKGHYAFGLCQFCYRREYEIKRRENPDYGRKLAVVTRRGNLRRAYGLTPEEYDQLSQQQGGLCAICGEREMQVNQYGVKRLAVDHDHETGLVRGLLCNNCNNGLGRFKDNPERLLRAVSYLNHEGLR